MTSVFGAPPLVSVPLERLVQTGLDPLRVDLSNRAARAPQELLETPTCLVTNLSLEQVSTFFSRHVF